MLIYNVCIQARCLFTNITLITVKYCNQVVSTLRARARIAVFIAFAVAMRAL